MTLVLHEQLQGGGYQAEARCLAGMRCGKSSAVALAGGRLRSATVVQRRGVDLMLVVMVALVWVNPDAGMPDSCWTIRTVSVSCPVKVQCCGSLLEGIARTGWATSASLCATYKRLVGKVVEDALIAARTAAGSWSWDGRRHAPA
jgi:hypothetical protein